MKNPKCMAPKISGYVHVHSFKKTDFLKSTILFFSSINERFFQHIFSYFHIDFVNKIFPVMLFSLWVLFYSNITDFFPLYFYLSLQLKSNEENKNGRAKHIFPGKTHSIHSGISKHFFTISQHLSVKSRLFYLQISNAAFSLRTYVDLHAF